MREKISFFWFRRDLRIDDNTGLSKALNGDHKIIPLFIFDSEITDELEIDDPRINFIYDQLSSINIKVSSLYNSKVLVLKGNPLQVIQDLINKYDTHAFYTNNDYEPYAINRDNKVHDLLKDNGVKFLSFKDQVIFEKNEITKDDKTAYVVYTPYMKKWKVKLQTLDLDKQINNILVNNFRSNNEDFNWYDLEYFGFKKSNKKIPNYKLNDSLIENYQKERDFPALDSTTKIGPHLRFGTVSIRKIVSEVINSENEVFLQELIWREFFMQILWFFPNTQTKCFKVKYEKVQWLKDEVSFKQWCEGKTGYPIVDAGMRELNSTGYMHNRVRMVTASFLCKHLLLDWRLGEAYFAKKLYDYESSSNIGNWQWAAGTGVDAAPYFRIFNPTTQALKFDKELKYINKWVTDLNDLNYPQPIVDHKFARQRCLEAYKKGLE
jgi:deoxyribodipyrimidine photo-lyase|tara:strand:+ start:2131 stop:3438 length:1308 start_codon:yes stop_codon:yes gene_type:complete